MPDDRFDSPAAGETDRPRRRPLRKWLALLLVWAVGLVIWGMYIIVILFLLSRIL
jgi:hypothetical protein